MIGGSRVVADGSKEIGRTGPEEPIRLFKRPWVTDPLIWIGAILGLVLGLVSAFAVARDGSNAGVIVVAAAGLVSGIFWWALSALLPAAVRFWTARRRRDTLLARTPEEADPGWHPDPTNLTRYRWWDGNAWQKEVNPGPVQLPIGRSGPILLSATVGIVLISSLWMSSVVSQSNDNSEVDAATAGEMLEDLRTLLPDADELQEELRTLAPASPSATPQPTYDPQLSESLAIAYGQMTEAVFAAAGLQPSDSESPSAYARNFAREVATARESWMDFNELLGSVEAQRQIGDYPPLNLLRRIDQSVEEFVSAAELTSQAMVLCGSLESSAIGPCIQTAQAEYGDRYLSALERVGEDIQELVAAQDEVSS